MACTGPMGQTHRNAACLAVAILACSPCLAFQAAGDTAMVGIEFAFRPLPQYEYWIADIAYTTRERAQKVPRKGYFEGVPELVVEVLSPSNSAREMQERRRIFRWGKRTSRNGAREWVCEPWGHSGGG